MKKSICTLTVPELQRMLDAATLEILRGFGEGLRYESLQHSESDDSVLRLGAVRDLGAGVYRVFARLSCGITAETSATDLATALALLSVDDLMPSRRERLRGLLESALKGMDSDRCDTTRLTEELLEDNDMEVYVHPSYVMDDDELLLVHGAIRKAKGVWPFIVQVERRNAKQAVDAVLELYDKEFK